MEGGRKSKDR